MAHIILLDNQDSFTYNLVDLLRSAHHQVSIYRHTVPTEVIIDAINHQPDTLLMLSPGPGIPKEAGCMMSLIEAVKTTHPIIGICLGHQAIIEAFGGGLMPAPICVHGKAETLIHDQQAMFTDLPATLSVARYHSWVAQTIPSDLIINAHCQHLVMAVRHRSAPICGFQFHPESILTPYGTTLLKQTIHWAQQVHHQNKGHHDV